MRLPTLLVALLSLFSCASAFVRPKMQQNRPLFMCAGNGEVDKPRFLTSKGPQEKGTRRQTIKFTINGPVVEMEVFGAVGDECLEITESFEKALGGTVIYREDKPERWQQKETLTDENAIFEQKYSEW